MLQEIKPVQNKKPTKPKEKHQNNNKKGYYGSIWKGGVIRIESDPILFFTVIYGRDNSCY